MTHMTGAFSLVEIDVLLTDTGWSLTYGSSTLFERAQPDGSRADYTLCDRSGRSVAAVDAKRAGINPVEAQNQGRLYAEQFGAPFVFLKAGQ